MQSGEDDSGLLLCQYLKYVFCMSAQMQVTWSCAWKTNVEPLGYRCSNGGKWPSDCGWWSSSPVNW